MQRPNDQAAVTKARRFRSSLEGGAQLVAPGCGDALSARLVEAAGFDAVYMSGGWTSGARGFVDVGLITLNEMVENAKYIAQAVDMPVLADADTGFGGFINVRRCVNEFELAGVAGVHLEDQANPKKCGLMSSKILVKPSEMELTIRAAADARTDPDFLVIARTDSLDSEGIVKAIERGERYFDAGADVLFVEGFRQESEIRAVAQAFPGRNLLFNRTPRGYAPFIPFETLHEWGYNIVLLPIHLILAATRVQQELLKELRETGACASFEDRMIGVDEFFGLLGQVEIEALEHRLAGVEA